MDSIVDDILLIRTKITNPSNKGTYNTLVVFHPNNNFTKAAKDWKVAFSKICKSKEDAIYLQRFIKRMKSKKFIQKVIENPKILDDLLSKE